MPNIELATQYAPYVDEIFARESKIDLLTNQDFSFNGAHSVKIYKVSTSAMNDYDRNGAQNSYSRFGTCLRLRRHNRGMYIEKRPFIHFCS